MKVLLAHTPEMRRNYYGDRSLNGLRAIADVILHEGDRALDSAGLVDAAKDADIIVADRMTAGRTRTFSEDAGEATLVIEVRDFMSGAILGRAVDRREVGSNSTGMRRTSVSNRSDFERVFRAVARISVNGLRTLQSTPPTPGAPAAGRESYAAFC